MTTQQRTYRGVTYSPAEHEEASSALFEHVYRGNRYESPLKHEAQPVNESVELHYRGSIYHHRQDAVARSMNN